MTSDEVSPRNFSASSAGLLHLVAQPLYKVISFKQKLKLNRLVGPHEELKVILVLSTHKALH